MSLVRREKGTPVPLPDGVVARMQLSPYRVQLAGIRTAEVQYLRLLREITLVGTVGRVDPASVSLEADAFVRDLPFLEEGQRVEAVSDGLPGHLPFKGEIIAIELPTGMITYTARIRLKILDPERELRPGTLLSVRTQSPIPRVKWWREAVVAESSYRIAVDLAAGSAFAPLGPMLPVGVKSLTHAAIGQALAAQGLGLAVPCTAVVDHGRRKLVFLERGSGMFVAVEVTVGPGCGDLYPVRGGLEAGQRVAVSGAFLLDAEVSLNHNLAATYFGAARTAAVQSPTAPAAPEGSQLSTADRRLAAKQKVCPVTGSPLDSMGGPIRVELGGRIIFVCCKGCEAPLRREPQKYLLNQELGDSSQDQR
jgi:Cu(I)/Ag(I) efflux system membrane fusion protein